MNWLKTVASQTGIKKIKFDYKTFVSNTKNKTCTQNKWKGTKTHKLGKKISERVEKKENNRCGILNVLWVWEECLVCYFEWSIL